MLKYEENLHLDERYSKLQSGGSIQKAISVILGIVGYAFKSRARKAEALYSYWSSSSCQRTFRIFS